MHAKHALRIVCEVVRVGIKAWIHTNDRSVALFCPTSLYGSEYGEEWSKQLGGLLLTLTEDR